MDSAQRLMLIVATVVTAFLLTVLTPVVASAASFNGKCITTATNYRVITDNAGTTSTNFVNMPQSVINFVQGGNAPGCVILTFTSVITTASTWMYVNARLDGTNSIDAGRLFGRVDFQDTRTGVFVFQNVAPGNHKIVLQFRSNNGGNVTVYNRTLAVSYRQ